MEEVRTTQLSNNNNNERRQGMSVMTRMKKDCLSFTTSFQQGFRYFKAFLVGRRAKKMTARNEEEASEADLQTAKMQVEATDAAEDTKKRLHLPVARVAMESSMAADHMGGAFPTRPPDLKTSYAAVVGVSPQKSYAKVVLNHSLIPEVIEISKSLALYKVGKVLCSDNPTKVLSRPSKARICVEIDISKEKPSRIWLGLESNSRWQTLIYEKDVSYCIHCCKQGHEIDDCRLINQKKNSGLKEDQQENDPEGKPTTERKQIWVKKTDQQVIIAEGNEKENPA
ncbi:hypothetical protein HHK36_009634 [Tetracentron sinense]|uniref:DUF4283 domain-containing protein n=1 Tax=Tetracentron sinense TaxID=13715 RepID=A0A834ZFK5_TETSI|nr:hypothetical protein HHK36_009634 [Tetracentron sinense]